MLSIGVLTTEQSLRHIMRIDHDMRESANITYLPYTSIDHLEYLYKQNCGQFDALLFSGTYPYRVVVEKFGTILKPHACFNISDRDYFKIIARLAVQNPNLDFSRVYFDRPEIPVDFEAVFGRPDVPLIGSAGIDWNHEDPSDWYLPLQDYYHTLWDSGKVDILVTRFGSMEAYFMENNIRHEFLYPARESMLEIYRGLILQIRASSVSDAAVCIGIVSSVSDLTKRQWELLGARLKACERQFNASFLIYENENRYELTSNISAIKALTKDYTNCPVTAFLQSELDFPVCVGWGCSGNIIDAHRNAQRAVKEAVLTKGTAAYIVTSDGVIIGPLSSVRRIAYTDAPNPKVSELAKRLNISPLYLSKIISILGQLKRDVLTAEDLAFYLNISSRSALRILTKMEAGGVATVHYRQQANLRGRPAKVYTLSLEAFL